MCGGWGVPEDDELPAGEDGCGKKKAADAGIDKTKRGFTTAAMASPVLMSLLSRPAWAQVCSISGLTSGNVSEPAGAPGPCTADGIGCTPGFWKNNPEAWVVNTNYSPGTCTTWNNGGNCKEWSTEGGTSFNDAFGCVAPDGAPDLTDTPTMMDILLLAEKSGTTNHAWQAHWVAALLNASASPSYGSSPQGIIDAVCGVVNGTFTDNNGESVTAAQLHEVLYYMNERGCPINAHGFCNGTYVNNAEGTCIPSCAGNQKFDVNTGVCIDKGSWVSGSDDGNGTVVSGHCSVEDALNGALWCTTTLTP